MNLLDLLFPKFCLGCGRWGRYFCSSCTQKIRPPPFLKCPVCEKPAMAGMTHRRCRTRYALDGLTSFFRYDGIIKKAIKKIKYRGSFDIADELITCIPNISLSFLNTLAAHNSPLSPFLIPVPLHWIRRYQRGFNQAELIARALGRRLDIPVDTNVLVRRKKTTPQVEMRDREERLKNMEGVFCVASSPFPELKKSQFQEWRRSGSVFLIDDVFTTGATLRSGASVLKRAGVPWVWGITLAQ